MHIVTLTTSHFANMANGPNIVPENVQFQCRFRLFRLISIIPMPQAMSHSAVSSIKEHLILIIRGIVVGNLIFALIIGSKKMYVHTRGNIKNYIRWVLQHIMKPSNHRCKNGNYFLVHIFGSPDLYFLSSGNDTFSPITFSGSPYGLWYVCASLLCQSHFSCSSCSSSSVAHAAAFTNMVVAEVSYLLIYIYNGSTHNAQ